jgi:hypothetical protein
MRINNISNKPVEKPLQSPKQPGNTRRHFLGQIFSLGIAASFSSLFGCGEILDPLPVNEIPILIDSKSFTNEVGDNQTETYTSVAESGPISGQGLDPNRQYYLVLSTNSTKLVVDADGDGTASAGEIGQIDGLIPVDTLTAEARQDGATGCLTAGYTNLVACPEQSLSLTLAGNITIENLERRGEALNWTVTETFNSAPDNVNFPVRVAIPKDFYRNGNLNINVRIPLVIDDLIGNLGPNGTYQTVITVEVTL